MITKVTGACSRTAVHTDWIPYMLEPSPISATVRRDGSAIATPTAAPMP